MSLGEDEEQEFMLLQSTDELVVGVYVQFTSAPSQEQFLRALQYFIDRTVEEDEDIMSGNLDTH